MTENEIFMVTLELLEAMRLDNLEETKNIVNYLNNNLDKTQYLDSFIPFYTLYETNDQNESLIYAITNLRQLQKVDQLKWNISINNLISNNNKNDILNFILKSLENIDNLTDYQLKSLIRLSVKIDRYDLLRQIRNNL